MIYGYCRATTSKQIESGYLEEQESAITDRYYNSYIFKEESLDINIKPEFNKLISKIKSEDIFVVTSLDRFSKSISDAFDTINELRNKGVFVHILNIGLFDNSVLGNILFDTISAINQFEKALLVERIQSGKNKAKKTEGFREGRPKKYTDEQIQEALDMLSTLSYKKVEEITGISKSTLIRAKKDAGKGIL
ncbi:recombinase family protein [Peptostreptococcus equinus]|uniref:Recombinase family protein n=1 Tax=Peptostreptococcus equinus TaxID=3003601 RepID=A0ABY7JR06_9FIRM|nr:recombinase family protein [Peptostreptococcus sp. CBA3647]WAW15792.1 recombinase family protein [Peptostreptococcus sp. CBA3647]